MTKLRQLRRRPLAVIVDACIVLEAYTLVSLLFFAHPIPRPYYQQLYIFLSIAVLVHGTVNLGLGLYRVVGRYAGIKHALNIIKASAVSGYVLLIAGLWVMPNSAIRAIAVVCAGGLFAFVQMMAVRFYPRVFYERSLRELEPRLNLLIFGAGAAGEMIAKVFQKEPDSVFEVKAFVDDNPKLDGLEIHEAPIYSPVESIPEIVVNHDIDEILIAIPSATLEQFQRIWHICALADKPVKTLRPLKSTNLGKVGLSDITEVEIEDVLGRQPVKTDYVQISNMLKGKAILISGAGGSIGSELVMQISHHHPARIILVDQDESALYYIHEKLSQSFYYDYELCVCDIKSESKIETIFERYRPDLVFHAAAYKHVPLMELHPDEAVMNNVFGTLNLATIAGNYQVECFINISTDKAVEPVNVLGATKCLSERLVIELGSQYPATRYCSVRFGNVLGSRGSVIPVFREQIQKGGPVTVTHPEMTRYFMLISEAVDLVLQAAAFEDSNMVYALEMGKPVRIVDLAKQMISLMNPSDSEKLEIVYTGLRPGEKLHELLIGQDETHEVTKHPMVYRIYGLETVQQRVLAELPELFDKAKIHDFDAIRAYLERLISSYIPFDTRQVGTVAEESISYGDSAVEEERLTKMATITGSLKYRWTKDESETVRR